MPCNSPWLRYRNRWYGRNVPFVVKLELRRRYNNNNRAYLADYRNDDESILNLLENGMQLFREWERKFLSRQYHRPKQLLEIAGRNTMPDTMDVLVAGCQPLNEENDLVLACIDFEGDYHATEQRGIFGFGIATLDSRRLFKPTETQSSNNSAPEILPQNFKMSK